LTGKIQDRKCYRRGFHCQDFVVDRLLCLFLSNRRSSSSYYNADKNGSVEDKINKITSMVINMDMTIFIFVKKKFRGALGAFNK
jgi:hypothetical protein